MLNFLYQFSVQVRLDEIGASNVVTSETGVVDNILNPVYLWAGIISIIIMIIAGYLYVISAGNAANVKKAKDAIVGSLVGLVIIILAFTITQFVIGRF